MEKYDEKENIEKLKNHSDMLMVYFGDDSCSVCVSMKPKLIKMLESYPNIKFLNINPNENRKLAAEYNIFAIPVIILYIQGKETIREARIISLDNLEVKIKRYYEMLYDNE